MLLSNGEFGDRLARQAVRFGLAPRVLRWPWGKAWDLEQVGEALAHEPPGSWVWGVHQESSTGVLNDLPGLVRVARRRGGVGPVRHQPQWLHRRLERHHRVVARRPEERRPVTRARPLQPPVWRQEPQEGGDELAPLQVLDEPRVHAAQHVVRVGVGVRQGADDRAGL